MGTFLTKRVVWEACWVYKRGVWEACWVYNGVPWEAYTLLLVRHLGYTSGYVTPVGIHLWVCYTRGYLPPATPWVSPSCYTRGCLPPVTPVGYSQLYNTRGYSQLYNTRGYLLFSVTPVGISCSVLHPWVIPDCATPVGYPRLCNTRGLSSGLHPWVIPSG